MELTLGTVKAVNEMLERLGCLNRWTWFFHGNNFDEANKQALNCLTVYLLAKHAEYCGKKIVWENFPKIAIYRTAQKNMLFFDTPEYIMHEIRKIGMLEEEIFEKDTKGKLITATNKEFADYICEGIGTYENELYKAATKIATYVELVENERKIEDEFAIKVQQITQNLLEFEDIPGVKEFSNPQSVIFKLLRKISRLRNQNRWANRIRNQGCSVLRHLFDTAVCAYLMAIENDSEDQANATKMFFMGIFHDVPETWTKDIPSPVKDRIEGFREASEEYERQVVEENLYSVLPDYLATSVKEVMMEEDFNSGYKSFLKGADYIAADMECWRMYRAGSKDEYYSEVLNRRYEELNDEKSFVTPLFKKMFDEMIMEVRRDEFVKELCDVFTKIGDGDPIKGIKKLKDIIS